MTTRQMRRRNPRDQIEVPEPRGQGDPRGRAGNEIPCEIVANCRYLFSVARMFKGGYTGSKTTSRSTSLGRRIGY